MTLEHKLEIGKTEMRIQNMYIANLYVSGGHANRYISQLKRRLAELEPGCPLLERCPPAMPEKWQYESISETEVASEHDLILSDRVDGILQNYHSPIIGVPIIDRMDVDSLN